MKVFWEMNFDNKNDMAPGLGPSHYHSCINLAIGSICAEQGMKIACCKKSFWNPCQEMFYKMHLAILS